jgi:hypothetical protein
MTERLTGKSAIITGAVFLLAGTQFDVLRDSHLGIYLIGTGLVLAGVEALYSREMSLIFSGETAPRHSGYPAVVWGLMLLCAGGAMIGYAYLTSAGLWLRVETTLAQYPGWYYVATGLLTIGLSILLFVDSSGVYFHPEANNILGGYATPDEPAGAATVAAMLN